MGMGFIPLKERIKAIEVYIRAKEPYTTPKIQLLDKALRRLT